MLSPEQNAIVVDYLADHSKRPLVAVKLWALCFKHFRTDTGESNRMSEVPENLMLIYLRRLDLREA